MLSLADELGMKLFYWHVMDSGKDSVDLLRRLLDRFGTGLSYVLVRNQVRGSDFSVLEQSGEQARAIGMGAHVVSVKQLHDSVMQKIDNTSSSFWKAKSVRQGRERPRPDGPPARQDVAARRLPRARRGGRLSESLAPARIRRRCRRPDGGAVAGERTARRRRGPLLPRRRLRPAARRRHGALDPPHRRQPGAARNGALGGGRRREVPAHRRPRRRGRRGGLGAQRPRRAARPRARPLVLVPLRRARRAEPGRPHPHRARGRREGDAALRRRELPALRRRPLRGLAPCRRREPGLRAVPRRLHLRIRRRAPARSAATKARSRGPWPSTAPATPPTRATRCCRRRTAPRRG